MAKNQEIEFSTTAGFNTDIGGLGIDEGMPPSRVNDAMRYLMKTRADGITRHVVKAAGSYTAVKADHNQFWRCTGAVTLNLTAAATLTDGWTLFVRANGGVVTVDPSGTELIDGATTVTMPDGYTAMIICTGTEFFVVDGGISGSAYSLSTTGSINAASLTTSGAVTAGSLVTTGAASVGSLAATGNITAGGTLTVTGAASTGAISASGDITTTAYIYGQVLNVSGGVIGGGGELYLRPHGWSDGSGQATLDTAGGLTISGGCTVGAQLTSNIIYSPNPIQAAGYRTKAGTSGGLQGNASNIFWGGSFIDVYIDASGFRMLSGLSDYRIKKDVQPLPSTWDKVKALRPISYSTSDFGELFKGNDEEQWGFIAHELQENLLPSAGIGVKDGERIQQIDLAPVVASLTKALQEAMVRIEALEAAA
jgi:hypothetical protein